MKIPRFFVPSRLGFPDWDTDEEDGDIIDPDADDPESMLVKEERYVMKHFNDIPTLKYYIAGEEWHRMYKRIETGNEGEFRLKKELCSASLTTFTNMVHYMDPDNPEGYLLHSEPSHDHYRLPGQTPGLGPRY